jgi:hypothetical protein
MKANTKAVLLGVLLTSSCLLVGCPGMPGAPGAGDQKMPPGVLPPPGLESGGARTLMGSTVTPPDNSYLLVSFRADKSEAAGVEHWQTCRRIVPLESCVLIEGLNYDGRAEAAPRDVNELIPYAALQSLQWKYEARPAPPAGEESAAESGPGASK